MPRVNIHIRQEDWSIWQSIEDKPEWIHHNLSKTERTMKRTTKRAKLVDSYKKDRDAGKDTKKYKTTAKGFTKDKQCKHFEYRGLCPVKGCENYIGDEGIG